MADHKSQEKMGSQQRLLFIRWNTLAVVIPAMERSSYFRSCHRQCRLSRPQRVTRFDGVAGTVSEMIVASALRWPIDRLVVGAA